MYSRYGSVDRTVRPRAAYSVGPYSCTALSEEPACRSVLLLAAVRTRVLCNLRVDRSAPPSPTHACLCAGICCAGMPGVLLAQALHYEWE